MAARGRELFLDMVMNDAAHKEGADWRALGSVPSGGSAAVF